MSKLRKKIFVSAIAAFMVAGVAVAPVAQAQTVAELQAQIASLLSTINALQAQIASLGGSGTTGGGVSGIPAGFTFTRNLSQGSSGSDVMYLQKLLNSNAATQVAASGVGSPGQETQYYGALTAAAVTKFQNLYASEVLTPLGLSAGTGFFGASSRTKANALIASGVSPTPTPTPTPGITTPGQEGSLIVTIASSPASGAVLNTGETEAVTGVDVKATGSDVLVNRLDLQFDTRPWQYISEMTVSDGTTSKTIAVTESNSTEVTVGTTYSVRVDGLNILVPKDTTKTITVTVKAVTGLPVGTTSKNIVLTFIANSLRGTDGAGLTQTAPTAAVATRTITVQEPSAATLEVTAASDNPKARAVIINSTAETAGVEIAKINVKAKNNDAVLRTLEFDDTDDASGTLKVVYLYDGSTLLASTSSIGSATSVLTNINLTIPKDTTKTLTVKADINKATGNYAEGASSTVVFEANSQGFDAEDATSFAAATVTGSTVAPGTVYFYTKAPKIALVSGSKSVTGVESGTASSSPQSLNAKFSLAITAEGGDIYIPVYSSTAASNGIVVATTTNFGPTPSTLLTPNYTTAAAYGSSANDTYVIRSGTTETFEVSANIAACPQADTSAFNGINTTNVKWGTTVATAQQPANTWTWGLTDFTSGQAFLPACS